MYPFLDGLRGLLAIWVLIYHADGIGGTHLALLPGGAIAVDIFMFVSGFLMAANYRARQHKEPWQLPSTWLLFYIRRFFRIAPLYYCALFVALTFRDEFAHFTEALTVAFPEPWRDALLYLDPTVRTVNTTNVLMHLTFLFGFFPSQASNNVLPDWSLALEMQFYAIFPFLMLLMTRFKYVWVIALLSFIYVGSYKLFGVYLEPPKLLWITYPQPTLLVLKINCFLIGMLIAEYHHMRDRPSMGALLPIALGLCLVKQHFLFGAAVIVVAALLHPDSFWRPFAFQRPIQLVRAVLSCRISKYAGDLSYGVYLFHLPVLLIVTYYLTLSGWYVALSGITRLVILLTLATPIIYAVALLGHLFVERRFIEIGKSLGAKYTRRLADAA